MDQMPILVLNPQQWSLAKPNKLVPKVKSDASKVQKQTGAKGMV